jgi:hypothetical protein
MLFISTTLGMWLPISIKNKRLPVGRPYEILMKTKNIKTILPSYSAIASSDKYPIKNYEGRNYDFQ